MRVYEFVQFAIMVENGEIAPDAIADTLEAMRENLKIFPYDEIKNEDIEKAFDEIQEFTSLVLYIVDNSRYYEFSNWKKWQRVDKPRKSNISISENSTLFQYLMN